MKMEDGRGRGRGRRRRGRGRGRRGRDGHALVVVLGVLENRFLTHTTKHKYIDAQHTHLYKTTLLQCGSHNTHIHTYVRTYIHTTYIHTHTHTHTHIITPQTTTQTHREFSITQFKRTQVCSPVHRGRCRRRPGSPHWR